MQKRKDSKGRVLKDGESHRKSDGLYMYRWTSPDKKRHTIYDASLEGLREKENKILHDLSDGIRVGENNVTINDVYKMWRADKKGLKTTTYENYGYMYLHYIEETFGERKVQQIRKSDVRRLYNGFIDTGKVAINTLENIHIVLHQVFKLAVEDEYIRTNPTDDVLGEVKRAHNYQVPKRHALTIPQQNAFLQFIKNTPEYNHWLPLFTFFLGTGCSVSEVVGIRWEDIHVDEGYVEINHNLVYHSHEAGGCYFSISTPKTPAGFRIIPLLPHVKQALEMEKAHQKEFGMSCKSRIDGYTDFVFLNRFGLPNNPQAINRTIKRISMAYNEAELDNAEKEHREPELLPPFSCHNLRHTFATRYCENETNLKVIQEILGHKDIATTMDVYAEATKDAKVKSFEGLTTKMKLL